MISKNYYNMTRKSDLKKKNQVSYNKSFVFKQSEVKLTTPPQLKWKMCRVKQSSADKINIRIDTIRGILCESNYN